MTSDTVGPYNRGFAEFSAAFEAIGFADIHKDALPFLPPRSGLLLDVGSGSGRDAAWFAGRGWDVVAVEPATALRLEASRVHRDLSIRWFDDRLPSLASVHRLGLTFDLIWLSGVWMHVPPDDRARAMRKLATLLRPGGRMVLTLRHGPAADDRPMWAVDAFEVERLGLEAGLALRVATDRTDDLQGRPGVSWQTVILDLPDDGAGALPLLRGVILRQEKSATYKLALLRCIARIADASPNVAREAEGGAHVELPLGLLALYWIRMFKPLVKARLPQRPGERMAFVTPAFLALDALPPFDLRAGASFYGDQADALRLALSHAARLIADMPATHLTFTDGAPVFPTRYGRTPPLQPELRLDQEVFWTYGTTLVPLHVWQALLRMSAWIEPMLVAEWVRLTQGYAAKAGMDLSSDAVTAALRWIEPERDTAFVRQIATRRLADGHDVSCVWSGRNLTPAQLDIDHCLPWSAWPCGDLWNLLPSSPAVNRWGKREKIVGALPLAAARLAVVDWWQTAYLGNASPIRTRFIEEARTTLPIAQSGDLDLDEVFQALDFRRLRLRQDTQIPEWSGVAQ